MRMTKEEAKEIFLNRGWVEVEGGIIYVPEKWREAYVVIADWLEQEPCEDCISREAAIRIAEQGQVQGYEWQFKKLVKLPSVTPQPEIGRWIDNKCSVCGKGIEDLIDSREWYENEEPNFCPFCGVKLEEEEE